MATEENGLTLEEALGEPATEENGLTIEQALAPTMLQGVKTEPLRVRVNPSQPTTIPRLKKPLISREISPSPTEALTGFLPPTREQERRRELPMILGAAGAMLGGPLAASYLGPILGGPSAAMLGEFAGGTLGGMAGGAEPQDAALSSAIGGVAGGATEGILRGIGRGAGIASGLPNEAIDRIIGARPSEANQPIPRSVGPLRRAFAIATAPREAPMPMGEQFDTLFNPPQKGEMREVGQGLADKVDAAYVRLSPGRLSKVNLIKGAEAAGVTVPTQPLLNKIADGWASAETAVGQQNSLASSRLQALQDDLAAKFPRGKMTPLEADAQLQAFQHDAEKSGVEGNTLLKKTYGDLKSTLRDSFIQAVDKGLPGSNMAKATAQAKGYLDSLDTIDSFMRENKPEAFVKKLANPENESERAALQTVEGELGTGGAIEKEIDALNLKKTWNAEEKGRIRTFMGLLERLAARKVAKGGLFLSRPAGALTAGGVTGFNMRPSAAPVQQNQQEPQ